MGLWSTAGPERIDEHLLLEKRMWTSIIHPELLRN